MLRPHPLYPHFNIGRKDNVIYYAWHDIPCLRSYTKPRNPRTPKQQANRKLHGTLTRLSGKTKDLRHFCFSRISAYKNSHTAFIGIQLYQLKHCKKANPLPIQAQIRWGKGPLPGVENITFSWNRKPWLKWDCHSTTFSRKSNLKNKTIWVVWNADQDKWQWSLDAGKRSDQQTLLSLPDNWKKEELYIWLLFYDPSKKQFSCDTLLHVKTDKIQASPHPSPLQLYDAIEISFSGLIKYLNDTRTFHKKPPKKRKGKFST